MNKVIIYTNPVGQLCIVIPAKGSKVEDLLKKDVPKGCKGRVVDREELPEDRTFRSAWVDKGSDLPISVDPTKAHAIREETLRRIRNDLLAKSDIELKIAEERGDELRKQALIDYRNELRDMPDKLGPLKRLVDPKKIKAFTPDILKRSMP